MNRCAAFFVAAAVVSAPALAQQLQRQFPANALRGEIVVVSPPEITLNGRPSRLSPGARIRGENNLIMLSGSVIGATLQVHYTTDTAGLVHDVWVLRPDEAAKPWPRTPEEAARWSFDPIAQTWSRR